MKETSVDYVRDAKRINYYIKYDPVLPVDTGWLKRHIMTSTKELQDKKEIKIFLSGKKVPYAVYLQEGTAPHDIPHAFGYGSIYPDRINKYTGQIPFGVGGRFDGFFHPGSMKHKDFIERVLVKNCIDYYKRSYDVIKIVQFK